MNEVQRALRGRRTIHKFQPREPDTAALNRAFEAARLAPNHRLTEPWTFILPGAETVAKIVALNTRLVKEKKGSEAARNKHERWSAVPGWVVVTCKTSEDELRSREDYAACCCAVQNMMVSLWSDGIGSKWGTGDITRSTEFFQLLGIDPAAEVVVGLFFVGYPEVIPEAAPRKTHRVIELP